MNKILKLLGYIKLFFYKIRGMKIELEFPVFFHPKARIIIRNKNAKIKFNNNCLIAKNCKIIIDENGKLELGKNVVLLENCYIEIGKDANLKIGNKTFLNELCRIVCLEYVDIGENVAIGPDVYIFDNDHIMEKDKMVEWDQFKSSKIEIEDNVWIGAKSIILRGSKIKHNSVIAAMSVVKFEVKENNLFYINKEKIFKEIK